MTFRCPVDLREHLQALADREGVDLSVVLIRFLEAGRAANPVSPAEVSAARLRSSNRKSRRTPGLVIPLSPSALSATPATAVTGAADENMEKMGNERGGLRTFGTALKRAA